MDLLTPFDRKSRPLAAAAGFASIFLLGSIDYLTGPEFSFSIFYLIPISFLALFVGRIPAVVGSIISAVSWLTADVLSGHEYSHQAIPYWNTLVRLGLFWIVAVTLDSLRRSRDRQEELRQFIVHDLRSPLSNVMMTLQILGEEIQPSQKSFVTLGIASCRRMLTLINSLLDLPRLERGTMPLSLGTVSIEATIDSAIEQVGIWAEQNKIRFFRTIDPRVQSVHADVVATERVLVNLLSNAIKHSPAGSTVAVRAGRLDDSTVAIEVADEGAGVPPEWAERVFDKYAQLDAGKSHVQIGSGLGLAYCRLAVGAQGGKIWLDSGKGRGTTVTFTLPAAEK